MPSNFSVSTNPRFNKGQDDVTLTPSFEPAGNVATEDISMDHQTVGEPKLSDRTGASVAEVLVHQLINIKREAPFGRVHYIEMMIKSMMSLYWELRTQRKWTVEELEFIRPHLLSIDNFLPLGLRVDEMTFNYQPRVSWYFTVKSTMKLITEDVPELGQMINTSDEMRLINETIVSWSSNPPFSNQSELESAQAHAMRFPDHDWWSLGNMVDVESMLSLDRLQI